MAEQDEPKRQKSFSPRRRHQTREMTQGEKDSRQAVNRLQADRKQAMPNQPKRASGKQAREKVAKRRYGGKGTIPVWME